MKQKAKKAEVSMFKKPGNWALLLGVFAAVLVSFWQIYYAGLILLLLGVAGGYMMQAKDSHQVIVYALGLWVGVSSLSGLSLVSPVLSVVETVGRNLATLAASAALVLALRAFAGMVAPAK